MRSTDQKKVLQMPPFSLQASYKHKSNNSKCYEKFIKIELDAYGYNLLCLSWLRKKG